MTVEERQAVREVLDYLTHDEKKDFESREEDERDNHIYLHIQVLEAWYQR